MFLLIFQCLYCKETEIYIVYLWACKLILALCIEVLKYACLWPMNIMSRNIKEKMRGMKIVKDAEKYFCSSIFLISLCLIHFKGNLCLKTRDWKKKEKIKTRDWLNKLWYSPAIKNSCYCALNLDWRLISYMILIYGKTNTIL